MAAVEGSLYLLATAIGLSSAYFDGPYERNVNDFRQWRAYWEPLADQVGRGGLIEVIEQNMFQKLKWFRKALPILRVAYFCAASFALYRYLSLATGVASDFDFFASRILVILMIVVVGGFQLAIFYVLKSTSEEKKDLVENKLLPQ